MRIGLKFFNSLFHAGHKAPESAYFFGKMMEHGGDEFYLNWLHDRVPQCDDMLLLLNEVLSKEDET
jgi:hypothetical protein